MKTQAALDIEKQIKKHYPELIKFYQDYLGNFCFTREQVIENKDDILRWLAGNEDYFLLFQGGYYYLTTFNK